MIDPALHKGPDIVPGYNSTFQKRDELYSTDLTAAMQKALNRFVGQDRNVIVRFDPLPGVFMEEHKAVGLCYLMLKLALYSNGQTKLLLFVKCEAENRLEELDLGTPCYRLSFQTNFPYSEEWYAQNKKSLEECNNLLAENGGRMELNTKGNGCLFWVLIPGKP